MRTVTRTYRLPTPLSVERRADPRRCRILVVVVEAGARCTKTVLRNVSVSGAFVEYAGALAERLRLRLPVPTLPQPLTIGAEVRWVLRSPGGDVEGVGVRFDAMRAREKRAWVRYVRSLG